MTLELTSSLQGRLAAAATEGLNVVYVAVVYFGGSVGTRYYSTRPITMSGTPWEAKLQVIPAIPKRIDPSAVRVDALNDDLTLMVRNTPEGEDGHYDSQVDFAGGRVQDLMTEVPLVGARVDVGMADMRSLSTMADIKWDGVYRVDKVKRNNKGAQLYCVDRMLHPGERIIGSTINQGDWPLAPDESFGQVRGPVFGKVDGLPMVPVEVGLFATLASEIDDQDGIIDISSGDLSQWPPTGYVEIGDEIVYYPVIDRTLKRLGSSTSKCSRGVGFPKTTPAGHADSAIAREIYSGKLASLNGAISSISTSIIVRSPGLLPPFGVLLIDNEAILYTSKNVLTLGGLVRGVAVPTLAKLHDAGSPVRTIPTGDGQPRYRYVVGEGAVDAVSNLRVQDENGNDLPYTGGSPVLSLQTMQESGKLWSVVDLPARPRFEKFEQSGSQVPQEWICETDGTVDSEGVAGYLSFTHWMAATGMSDAHIQTWPRAIDPNASTRAVILEATTGKNIFSVSWNGHFDSGLNAPRGRYGRFRDARLRCKVQFDRQTSVQPGYQVYSNDELVKTGVFKTPTLGGGLSTGDIKGTQTLPRELWQTQAQSLEVRLASRTTDWWANGTNGYWVDPIALWDSSGGHPFTSGRPDHSAVTNGDTRMFLSGSWGFIVGHPIGISDPLTAPVYEPLHLYSTNDFHQAGSNDKPITLVITLRNPATWQNHWTGWTGSVAICSDADGENIAGAWDIALGKTEAKAVRRIDVSGYSWAQIQSIRITVKQLTNVGGEMIGATVGNITAAIEYATNVHGQDVDTIVDGAYFHTDGVTSPSTVFEQNISLGAVAKDWGRRHNRDPWDFFTTSIGLEALRFTLSLPTAGDGLQFAVADVVLELEYDALTVVYDGTLLADVDGRTGVPLSGGGAVVLQNPVDLLAYLVDSSEFFGFAGDRAGDWLSIRTLCDTLGWKLARAVVEEIPLRELVASLCGDCRLLLLADALKLYVKFRIEESNAADSVRTLGVQELPERALVSDEVDIDNRLEDLHNSIGYYYRKNYLTGSFRAVIEERDLESIRLYNGERRITLDLHWFQSSRGYAGGLPEQKAAIRWVTKYGIDKASRVWDYATFEVSAAAAEDLQRYDVVILNYPRSGYYETPGRITQIQRLENPMRFQVTAEMNRSTLGYIWQSQVDPRTYIKLAEAGSRMDFVVQGTLEAQLTSAGLWRCRGDISVSGTSTIETAKVDVADAIHVYRERRDGANNGKFERMLTVGEFGDVTLYAYDDGSGAAGRNVAAPGTLLNLGGVGGIVDTVAPSQTGQLEFYLANRQVLVIDSAGWTGLGGIKANLGLKMGGIQ